jgi:SAM-dependent methyltransferase
MTEDAASGGEPLRRFFNDITPLVYDLQFAPDYPDVALWVDLCREWGGPVLEIGCGTGRVTIPLARAGLDVVGIDLAEPMLAAARQRVADEPMLVRKRIRLLRGDMCDFRTEVACASAVIPASTFSVLLTREDQESTLSSIHACLRREGHLAFDVRLFGDWIESGRLPPVRCESPDGRLDFTEERSFDFDRSTRVMRATVTYTFRAPAHLGSVTEIVEGLVLSQADVEDVLRSTGFVVAAVWGDYDRTPLQPESDRMIFIARKAQPWPRPQCFGTHVPHSRGRGGSSRNGGLRARAPGAFAARASGSRL